MQSKLKRRAMSGLLGAALFTTGVVGGSAAVPIEIVALSDDPVVGADRQRVLTSVEAPPVINAAGNLAVFASIGLEVDSTIGPDALLTGVALPLSVRVQAGDAVPGEAAGVEVSGFANGVPPVFNSSGQLSIRGVFDGPGISNSNRFGVITVEGGTLRKVAREGDPAPGAAPGIVFNDLFFSRPRLSDTGQTVFRANLGPSLNSFPNQEAIYAESSGTLSLVALEGTPAPGFGPGIDFRDLEHPVQNRSGQLAFKAIVDTAAAIYAGVPGQISPVAITGEPAPDFGDGTFFISFGDPVINTAGRTAFWSILRGGSINGATEVGIFSEAAGTLSLVAQTGTPAPAAGPGVNYSFLEDPLLSDGGHTVFAASLTGDAINADNNEALFRHFGGQTELVVQAGDPAPGTGAGVVFASTFRAFAEPLVNASGQVAFLAELDGFGVNDDNNQGLFATDADGQLRLVARTGDPFDLDPDPGVTDLKAIEFIEIVSNAGGGDGRPTGLNDAGQLAFYLDFGLGQSGVFRANLSAAAVPGDFDSSGQVEQGDLNLVLNNWGSDRGAWANAGGLVSTQVDQEELNAVLNNWGATAAPSFTANPSVPEPAVAALAGLAALAFRRRSR
ncbi:MAG: choice-of-anchor tandem repeat NxxGxxAF-containing protein [Planctomycetota bacterium]